MKILDHAISTVFLKRICIIASLLIISSVSVRAQSEKVTFDRKTATVADAVNTIQKQTKYGFAFDDKVFDVSRSFSVAAGTHVLEDVLKDMKRVTGFSYMITEGYIIINSPVKKQAAPVPVYDARTDDIYSPSKPGEPDSRYRERMAAEPVEEPVTVPEPEPVAEPELPAPYSSYTTPDIYEPMSVSLPHLAVKTNLLYGVAALALNLGGEVGITPRSTIEFTGSWNRWNRIGTLNDNKKLNHWILRPEYRWWTCERFNGHFFGVHAFYAKYNISEYKIPMLFKKDYRYKGDAYGAGITYGYHLPVGKKWGFEFHVGLGVARLKYDRFDCTLCSDIIDNKTKTYFGPTRAGVSLVFMIK